MIFLGRRLGKPFRVSTWAHFGKKYKLRFSSLHTSLPCYWSAATGFTIQIRTDRLSEYGSHKSNRDRNRPFRHKKRSEV